MFSEKANVSTKVKLIMAPGGGFVAKIVKDDGGKPG
jgi:hypothetical protein